jgi:putative phage-type endonuclease
LSRLYAKGVIELVKQILDKRNMTETDWQEYRKNQKGIGGSDVATILGLNPYKTAFTLWLEKTGQIEPPEVNNEYVEWGNILEPVIRDKFAKETGFEVTENHYVLQHDLHEFMVANVDGEVVDDTGEKGILEIKTASERMKSDWIDGPPHHYMLQIQHYLAVLEYNYAYVAVLIGGNHFKYFRIDRDDYVIDKIISAEAEFTRLVEENIAPEISGHSADSDYLNQAYPDATEEEGELSKELFGLSLRYTELQKEIKALQDEADYIKNRVKLEAKNFKVLRNDLIKISMPTIRKVSFDSKKFAEDYPDLYQEYKTKVSSYRSFTVSTIRRE